MSKDPCHVWLLHGTFGNLDCRLTRRKGQDKNKKWFRYGSNFYKSLSRSLQNDNTDFRLLPFLWSGKNLAGDREIAAKRLAKALQRSASNGTRKHIIIAHSHAGNIAVRALEYIQKESLDLSIITLATPFVEVKERYISASENNSLILLFMSVVATISFSLFLMIKLSFGLKMGDYPFLFLVMFSTLCCLFAAHALSAYTQNYIKTKTRQLCSITELKKEKREGVPILILKSPNDEAELAMAAGTIGNMLSNFIFKSGFIIYSMFSFTIFLSIILTVIIGIPWLILYNFFYRTTAYDKYTQLFQFAEQRLADPFSHPLAIYLGMIGIIAFSLIIGAACKAVYGFDLFPSSLSSSVSQSSSLDNSASIDIVTLYNPSTSGMMHSIYNNPDCVPAIAAWIESNE